MWWWEQVALLRCPAQFGEFRSEFLNFQPRIRTPCANKFNACFFISYFSEKLWPLLYFFASLYRSYLWGKKKNRQALNLLVSACDQHGPKKSHPNTRFIIMSGAWAIYRSGNTLAGPARILLYFWTRTSIHWSSSCICIRCTVLTFSMHSAGVPTAKVVPRLVGVSLKGILLIRSELPA